MENDNNENCDIKLRNKDKFYKYISKNINSEENDIQISSDDNIEDSIKMLKFKNKMLVFNSDVSYFCRKIMFDGNDSIILIYKFKRNYLDVKTSQQNSIILSILKFLESMFIGLEYKQFIKESDDDNSSILICVKNINKITDYIKKYDKETIQ